MFVCFLPEMDSCTNTVWYPRPKETKRKELLLHNMFLQVFNTMYNN